MSSKTICNLSPVPWSVFETLSDICKACDKPLVLMIDEVDSASNNQIFIDFLSQLRAQYINRFQQAAFQSVILASVYDIKNLKLKIHPEVNLSMKM